MSKTKADVEADLAATLKALYDLVRAHNGYQHGMGPCICAAHENARKLLGISRGDECPRSTVCVRQP